MYKTIVIVLIIAIIIFIYLNGQESGYQKISPQEAKHKMELDKNVFLLDVRTQQEYKEAHISGSILVPVDQISTSIDKIITDKDKEIIVYCRSGNRSKTAVNKLLKLGYKNVYDLGGINSWPYEVVK